MIKGLDPFGLVVGVTLLPSLQKELTAPTSPGHGPGALDLCQAYMENYGSLKSVPF